MQYSTLQYVWHCTHGKLHEVHMHILYVCTSVIISVTAEAEQVDAHTQGTVSHTYTRWDYRNYMPCLLEGSIFVNP